MSRWKEGADTCRHTAGVASSPGAAISAIMAVVLGLRDLHALEIRESLDATAQAEARGVWG